MTRLALCACGNCADCVARAAEAKRTADRVFASSAREGGQFDRLSMTLDEKRAADLVLAGNGR